MRELTESGGIGLAPTDSNWTGKVVTKVPWLYPIGSSVQVVAPEFLNFYEGDALRGQNLKTDNKG